MKDPTPCDSCAATGTTALIRFVRVHGEHGLSWMPVNAGPDPAGNVALGPNGTARVLAKDQKPTATEVLYQPHFATCVAPEAHRRPAHRQRRHEARAKGGQPPRRPQPGGQTELFRINPGRTP